MKKELRVYVDLANVLRSHGYEEEDYPEVFDNARGIARGMLVAKIVENQDALVEAEKILRGEG